MCTGHDQSSPVKPEQMHAERVNGDDLLPLIDDRPLTIRISHIRKAYRIQCGSARVVSREYPRAIAPRSKYRRMRKSQWSRNFQMSFSSKLARRTPKISSILGKLWLE